MTSTAFPNAVTHYVSVDYIPCDNSSPKPPASAYDGMMTIEVEVPSQSDTNAIKKYQVYRGVLCFHSDFFNKALNGPFKEGGAKSYRLDNNVKPETFELYYNWMNTSIISYGYDSSKSPHESDDRCLCVR
ncbi:hypothetical protein BU23DRAFT_178673 [Bimuria novae-zelandiae CBS 107.79]|uniref:BTB domain-containing protein n=1 Tax=Bimuria novae-zelandiae CBS 107.79 TaxID=1447943 RepID=A0A6A5V466_9PLEO|nr:hypothetical protein BU23DRAFT_178673 [Bimuria novae-zelandiae CBS 107.79]